VHLVRKWVKRKIEECLFKEKIDYTRDRQEKRRILYYSKRPLNTETGSIGNNILLLVIVKGGKMK
jgi:hypothetical protein